MPEAGILEIISRVGGIGGVLAVVVLYMAYTTLGRIVTAYRETSDQLLNVVEQNTVAVTKSTAVTEATQQAVVELRNEVRWLKTEKRSPQVYEDFVVGLDKLLREQRGESQPTVESGRDSDDVKDARRRLRDDYKKTLGARRFEG